MGNKISEKISTNQAILSPLLGVVSFIMMVVVIKFFTINVMMNEITDYEAFRFIKEDIFPIILVAAAMLNAISCMLHHSIFPSKDISPKGPADEMRWWSFPERIIHFIVASNLVVLTITGFYLIMQRDIPDDNIHKWIRIIHSGDVIAFTGMMLFTLWYKKALPETYDKIWLKFRGGLAGYEAKLPAGKFNAGQKIWFWIATLTGITMGVTGYQLANNYSSKDAEYIYLIVVHSGAAIMFVSFLVFHLYLTIFVYKGSLQGMITGKISKKAALFYHSEEVKARTVNKK